MAGSMVVCAWCARLGAWVQECVGVGDGMGDVDEFLVGLAGVVAEEFEGGGFVVWWRSMRMPSARSVTARRLKAPSMAVVLGEVSKGDAEAALEAV